MSIPGTIQSKLAARRDWQPACEKTFLTYDAQAGIWEGTFELPAGAYEYKAALNKTWDENYGLNAARGANIPLVLSQPARVTFRYDHRTHWVADSAGSPFATVIGSFSPAIGCGGDRAATCPGAWLQDPDGDGTFALITSTIPAGSYDARVQVNGPAAAVCGAGGAQDGPAVAFSVSKTGDEIFFGYDGRHTYAHNQHRRAAPKGDLRKPRAHWVAKDTISWNVIGSPKYRYSLFYDPGGKLDLRAAGDHRRHRVAAGLLAQRAGRRGDQAVPTPGQLHRAKLPPDALANLPAMLKGQLAVAVRDENGKMLDAAGLQIPGVLDDLYHYDGPLGVAYAGATPTLRVWAPTARAVALHLFADATTSVSTTVALRADPASGVWSAEGTPDWTGQYYLREVEVYVPALGKVVQNLVTDPYSISLAANSTRSQIVNLADASLKPAEPMPCRSPRWPRPKTSCSTSCTCAISASSTQACRRPSAAPSMAFTHAESNGMRHLKRLATAGVTHVHQVLN